MAETDFATTAATLGFLKPAKYAAIERERRWLCHEPPLERADLMELLTDLYVAGTRLRLREMRDVSTGEAVYKLSKKGDLSPERRLITTIYLTEAEHALLRDLPGVRVRKLRHRLAPPADLSIDVFQGALEGLVTAEREFETDEAMAAYVGPAFLGREITADLRYSGGSLAANGRPVET